MIQEPHTEKFLARLLEIAPLSTKVYRLSLVVSNYNFQPGQYLQLWLNDSIFRCYSIASSPAFKNLENEMQLDLIMGCHNEDSVSLALLFNIIKEQMAIISAPTGNAWWRHENRPTMLIVGGTGYAYARGIIKHLELLKMSCKIQLVWGERESASFYELSWLDNVKRNLKWFDYQLWAETVLENRKINQGNLIDALRQTNETCLFDFRYYLAGSVQMVRTLHAYLRSIGIATEDIISDVIFIN